MSTSSTPTSSPLPTPQDGAARVLITGALGQLGQELTAALQQMYGPEQVFPTDVRQLEGGPQVDILDVCNPQALLAYMQAKAITHVYHLAALLSAKGEQQPKLAWRVNMDGLLNVLEAATSLGVHRVFWPSSIAVFGPSTPSDPAPQHTLLEPTTMYGITKLAGEQLCAYFRRTQGLDVRSLRYPGLISYGAAPGGGTTDYAVDMYFQAVAQGHYTSFIAAGTRLPMLYMPDAVRATLELMEAPSDAITVPTSYNLGGLSFDPEEQAQAIRKVLPAFTLAYQPDFRQQIAESWPNSVDDTDARRDWGWQPAYDLEVMTQDMLAHVPKPMAV